MRSPLRYPGGKTRARSIIVPKLTRQRATRLISPFIGGGSVELAWLSANPHGVAECFDLYEPLAEFWRYLLIDPQGVATLAKMHMPCERDLFYKLQSKLGELQGIEKAAAFFVLNRCSFSGATNSGGMSPGHPRFTESSIDRVRNFRAPWLRVRRYDAFELLAELADESPDDKVVYLDPPYAIEGAALYGDNGSAHRGFNHQEFARLFHELSARGWRMLLSYNDCGSIRALYNTARIETASWSYGMRAGDSSEVLIYSETWSHEAAHRD
tara:strand:+ start:2759 stop:3565 length:807 start_codon:yes stop_codon:yes gene_type:complete